MSKSKKLVPRRRFKEFQNADAWEQRKLGDIVNIGSGRDYKHLSEGKIPVFGTGGFMLSVNRALSYTHDAIGIGRKGTVNNPYILRAPFWTVDTLFYAIPQENYPLNFVFCIFKSIDWRKKDESTGVPSLSKASIITSMTLIPNFDEQIEIGNFFDKLNHLITLHQRKLDRYKELKSAYLSEMFPAEGECKPKRRFSGFTDAWEQRKLGELAEFNPKAELPNTFVYVDLESVVGTEVISHREESKASAPSRAQRLAKHGDIFYQTVRPYQRNNYLFEKLDNNYVFSTGYAQLRPYCDSKFLFCLVQTDIFVKCVLDKCTGTNYPAVSTNDLANSEISIPNNDLEQKAIADYFRNLDNFITLHQRKLDKLKNVKKAYLNEMFPETERES